MKNKFAYLFSCLVFAALLFSLISGGSAFGKQDGGCMSGSGSIEVASLLELTEAIVASLNAGDLAYMEDPYQCYEKCMNECAGGGVCDDICARKCGIY